MRHGATRHPAVKEVSMPLELVEKKPRAARPVHLVAKDGLEGAGLDAARSGLGEGQRIFRRGWQFARSSPARPGTVAAALFGTGKPGEARIARWRPAPWPRSLPEGDWRFAGKPGDADALRRWA